MHQQPKLGVILIPPYVMPLGALQHPTMGLSHDLIAAVEMLEHRRSNGRWQPFILLLDTGTALSAGGWINTLRARYRGHCRVRLNFGSAPDAEDLQRADNQHKEADDAQSFLDGSRRAELAGCPVNHVQHERRDDEINDLLNQSLARGHGE